MTIKDWIIKKLGGYTSYELEEWYGKGEKFGKAFANWLNTEQKKQQDNSVSGEISSIIAISGIQRLAYSGELANTNSEEIVVRYPDNSIGVFTICKDVVKDKKKVRSRKQDQLNPRPSRRQRNNPRRQHGSDPKSGS